MKARKKIRVEDLIKNFPTVEEKPKVETNFKLVTDRNGKCSLVEVQNILN